jgi:nucleolar pre-ribosomal-associated protein 2
MSEDFDLGIAHGILMQTLSNESTFAGFSVIARTVALILDAKPSSISQWHIETTLSGVTTISLAPPSAEIARNLPKVFLSLCQLIEIIVKRHRVRLEGHFHLFIMATQALLASLLRHSKQSIAPPVQVANTTSQASGNDWIAAGKRFSRLLEHVCEPSVVSVTKANRNILTSAQDAAKRSAGQHMYMVLMTYIKSQLEYNVPVGVREALEPGIFAVIRITTEEGRYILNEALDDNGRVVFREIYRRWRLFGKEKIV